MSRHALLRGGDRDLVFGGRDGRIYHKRTAFHVYECWQHASLYDVCDRNRGCSIRTCIASLPPELEEQWVLLRGGDVVDFGTLD